MLSVSLLGDFRITDNDTLVTGVDTPRLQSLLAYLLLHTGVPQSRAHVAFLFWPDSTEGQARTNLRHVLYRLRGAVPDPNAFLHADAKSLWWRPDDQFYTALAQAEQASVGSDPSAARAPLEQAIALYRGELLPSCYDDWILPERERLREAYLGATEQLVQILEDQRQYRDAIRHARRLQGPEPLQEATTRRLMRLHALDGDRAGALRIYHECATVLERELGVQPSPATEAAYKRLLAPQRWPAPVSLTSAASPLVGRDEEWRQLQDAWRSASAGRGSRMVVLRGEAGIGKTRLLEELLQWATRQGVSCANARCYAAEGQLAYAPVTAWLRAHALPPLEDVWLAEIARLLPELTEERPNLPRLGSLTEVWQRRRLFEALSRAVLGGSQPLMLTIDDFQWCDRETLEWLHFLLRFDDTARMLVVGAYRPEDVEADHTLVSLLHDLRQAEMVMELDLHPLDETSTRVLGENVAGRRLNPETAQFLYRETEGNPLFVVEKLRAGLPLGPRKLDTPAAGRPAQDRLTGDSAPPPQVQAVLKTRLDQVSASAREQAGLAATIGREFNYQLLVEASDGDEDRLVRELDELWRRRIVRERGADAYDFTHEKLREIAYNSLSGERRRLLHRRVAQALETLHAGSLGSVSYELATHYEHAGLPAQAVPYYLGAAEMAHQIYANEDAIELLQRGLTLLEAAGATTEGGELYSKAAADLWERLGDVLELTTRHEEALRAYENAQAQTASPDRIKGARLHRKAAAVLCEQRRYGEALEACHRAETALGRQPDENSSQWWEEWLEVQLQQAWVHYWLCQWPKMDELVTQLEPLAQARGSAAGRQRFLTVSCLMRLRRTRYTVSNEMLENSHESLALSLEMDSPKVRVESQFELGFLHLWRREMTEAEEHLRAALQLAETYRVVPMRVLCLTYLTVLHRFRGQTDEVSTYALRAQEIGAAAQMPDYVSAAKANQAWVAWRRRELSTAEQLGKEAIDLWQQTPLVYPFQWQALWPLIGSSWTRGREDETWAYVQVLLTAKQQRLPDDLHAALEAAIAANARGEAGTARFHLERAMAIAREMGYL